MRQLAIPVSSRIAPPIRMQSVGGLSPRSGIVTHKDVAEAQRITDDIGDGRSRLGARSNLSERSRAGIAVDCLVSAEADKYVVSTSFEG